MAPPSIRSVKMSQRIDPKILKELVEYNGDTGQFTWKCRDRSYFKSDGSCISWNSRFAGKPAFNSENGKGYLAGELMGRTYKSHHVAWAIIYGEWPKQIDHINGDRSDNRITNLRQVNDGENSRNRKTPKSNISGQVGVFYDRRRKRWVSRIHRDGERIFIGHFKTKFEAVEARRAAEIEHGYHPNHGRVS